VGDGGHAGQVHGRQDGPTTRARVRLDMVVLPS
jgi:hypothetical protein